VEILAHFGLLVAAATTVSSTEPHRCLHRPKPHKRLSLASKPYVAAHPWTTSWLSFLTSIVPAEYDARYVTKPCTTSRQCQASR
jgi:hypothetical protein